jgi:hypothetical protein
MHSSLMVVQGCWSFCSLVMRVFLPECDSTKLLWGCYFIKNSIDLIGTHLKNLWDPTQVRVEMRYSTPQYPISVFY